MKEYGDVQKAGNQVVRVHRDRFKRKEYIHVRTWYEFQPGDPDSLKPSQKGAAVEVGDLPRLRSLLEAAEADCLERGLLEIGDYERIGLEPPAELLHFAGTGSE